MEILNLKEKLEGKIPVTYTELKQLIDSWGRYSSEEVGEQRTIYEAIPIGECYDVSKVDISALTNITFIFYGSKFNGDISNWNIENVKYADFLFCHSDFNGDISNWNFEKIYSMNGFVQNNKNFAMKYNDGYKLPISTTKIKEWMINNQEKMKNLNPKEEEMDSYLDSFDM